MRKFAKNCTGLQKFAAMDPKRRKRVRNTLLTLAGLVGAGVGGYYAWDRFGKGAYETWKTQRDEKAQALKDAILSTARQLRLDMGRDNNGNLIPAANLDTEEMRPVVDVAGKTMFVPQAGDTTQVIEDLESNEG